MSSVPSGGRNNNAATPSLFSRALGYLGLSPARTVTSDLAPDPPRDADASIATPPSVSTPLANVTVPTVEPATVPLAGRQAVPVPPVIVVEDTTDASAAEGSPIHRDHNRNPSPPSTVPSVPVPSSLPSPAFSSAHANRLNFTGIPTDSYASFERALDATGGTSVHAPTPCDARTDSHVEHSSVHQVSTPFDTRTNSYVENLSVHPEFFRPPTPSTATHHHAPPSSSVAPPPSITRKSINFSTNNNHFIPSTFDHHHGHNPPIQPTVPPSAPPSSRSAYHSPVDLPTSSPARSSVQSTYVHAPPPPVASPPSANPSAYWCYSDPSSLGPGFQYGATPHSFVGSPFQYSPSPRAPTSPAASRQTRAAPRDVGLNGLAPRVLVSRHDRGTTPRDIQKNYARATQALDDNLLLRYMPHTDLLDPATFSTDAASYFSSLNLSITTILDHLAQWDMLTPLCIPEWFDHATGDMSVVTSNIYLDHTVIPLETVFDWQRFIHTWFLDEDRQSDEWALKFHLNCLQSDLQQDVRASLSELDPSCVGASSAVAITLSKLSVGSYEMTICLQSVITKFSITLYPSQDVNTGASHIKAAARILLPSDQIPPRAVIFVLRGMAASADEHFNGLCRSLETQETMMPAPRLNGTSRSAYVLKRLMAVLEPLIGYHRNAKQSGTWPALSSSSSSSTFQVLAATTTPSPSHSTQPSSIDALASALVSSMSQLSPGNDVRRGSSSNRRGCFICGDDHIARDCPQNNRNNQRSTSRDSSYRRPFYSSRRDNSRGRSPSRDSSRPRDGSRGRSFRRPDTPGRPRDSSRSRDRTVGFERDVKASALTVSVGQRSYESDDGAAAAPVSAASALLARLNQSKE